MTITELSLKRPSLVIVVFLMLGILGLASYATFTYELIPSLTPPIVTVATVYPGASPDEVETSVTKRLEDAVATVEKIKRISSSSRENLSVVTVEFHFSARESEVLQEVQRRVNQAAAALPPSAKVPEVSSFTLDELPVLRIGVTAALPPRELTRVLEDRVVPRLAQLEGVGRVTLLGGEPREIDVGVASDRLRAAGLSMAQVDRAITSSNRDVPAGKVAAVDRDYSVRVLGNAHTLDELRSRVIAVNERGSAVRLRDVATVTDGVKDRTTITRVNGRDAIGLLVQKQGSANTVAVCAAVLRELGRLERAQVAVGLTFDVAQDGSLFTRQAAQAVRHDLLLAVILVAGVMLVFLHSLRDPLIVMVAIPTSLVTTFVGMALLDFTLNLMTMLAMSLSIGILVDDAMVVHENIARHLHLGEDRRVAALNGRNEIGFSALALTLVDVVVFVPLSLLPGLVGNIIRQFAIVMVISTLVSLLVSFTLTPMLASRFARHTDLGGRSPWAAFGRAFDRRLDWLKTRYGRALSWSLDHRALIGGGVTCLFVGALALVASGVIGSEFVSMSDRSELSVVVELPPGSSLTQTDTVARRIEQLLLARRDVKKVFTAVGMSNEGFSSEDSANATDFSVSLVPKEERTRSAVRISEEIKAEILQLPGVKARVSPIGIFGTANGSPIVVVVTGSDRRALLAAAEMIAGITRSIRGTDDVRLSAQTGKPELTVEIDHERMSGLGLSLGEVGQGLRVALTGDDTTSLRLGDLDVPIRVRLDADSRSDPERLRHLAFATAGGAQIELRQFASVATTQAPTKRERRNRNSSLAVMAQSPSRPAGDVGAELRRRLSATTLPAGVEVSFEGDLESQDESFGRLMLAFLAALVAVYLVMVALYDSFVHPWVVLFSIPTAIIGALGLLAVTGATLNIFSILGMIVLVGLVGKNAILLVDRANAGRREGLSLREALVDAGTTRLRPILMTSTAMVSGMLPIALAAGAGAEWKNSLAWVLIGGLSSSLLLTLVLVPVVYSTVEGVRERLAAMVRRLCRPVSAAPAEPRAPGAGAHTYRSELGPVVDARGGLR